MTYAAPVAPIQSRMSKSALFSLIFGILGCIPFASGILAIIFGLIGFIKTGKPGVTGRWMAIVGGILGLISVVVWGLFFGTITAAFFAVMGMTEAPRAASHDFVRALAANDKAAIAALSTGLTEAELQDIGDVVRAQGTFTDTTFTNRKVENDVAEMAGTAKFSTGEKRISVHLIKVGNDWKVDGFSIK